MQSFFLNHFSFFKYNYLTCFYNALSISCINSAGRNNAGRITSYHRGSRHKTLLRFVPVDRLRLFFFFCPGLVVKTKYFRVYKWFDFICYDNGFTAFYRSVEGLLEGDFIINDFVNFRLGSFSQILNLPVGSFINCISFFRNFNKTFSSSPGSVSKVLKKDFFKNLALVDLPSGEKRFISLVQLACRGRVASVSKTFLKKFLKAGTRRHLGRRPVVRGTAMNPVDHPHGGGQGKTSGGRPSSSPWGVYTKGGKTTKFKRLSRFRFIS
jgi:large subunit ribosomal protein L2